MMEEGPTTLRGGPSPSRNLLFKMPPEIINAIVDLLGDDKKALASLALVNRNCRKLAQSRQFTQICLHNRPTSLQLLLKLLDERLDKTQHHGLSNYVRRLKFRPLPHRPNTMTHDRAHESFTGGEDDADTPEQRAILRSHVHNQFIDYESLWVAKIASGLPYLKVFKWFGLSPMENMFPLDSGSFAAITRSSARHVVLRGSCAEVVQLAPPLTPASWPISTLDMDLRLLEDEYQAPMSENAMSSLFASLLRLCAPTLWSLTWRNSSGWSYRRDPIVSFGGTPISFPRLTHVRITNIRLGDLGFSSFFPSSLQHIELSSDTFEQNARTLLAFPVFDELQSFIVSGRTINPRLYKPITKFISKHDHIKKLYLDDFGMGGVDTYIIPALAKGSFENLVSLSLSWESDQKHDPFVCERIPETALRVIGEIFSLQKLSLVVGSMSDPKRVWLIDHDQIRANFQRLTRLRALFLVGDTYEFHIVPFSCYYIQRSISLESLALGRDSERILSYSEICEIRNPDYAIWEKDHQNRMLREAEVYARILPKLTSMFCGQWRIRIEHHQQDGEDQYVKVEPIGEYRDDQFSPYDSSFGMVLTEEDDDNDAFVENDQDDGDGDDE